MFFYRNFNSLCETNMSSSSRVPLWILSVGASLAIFTLLGLFFFGSYSGVGSSL